MSSNLTWEPEYIAKKTLSDKLKFILRKQYGSEGLNKIRFTENDVQYLSGVLHTTDDKKVQEDCMILISAINQYGIIILNEEY